MTMSGRIAFVTGASRGIGRAVAMALAERGSRIAVGYGTDEIGAKQTVESILALGGDAMAVQGDVGQPSDVDGAFHQIEERWGRVDILVNNAGAVRDVLLLRMTDDDWEAVRRTNLDGPLYCIRRAAAGMVRGRWGRIVNVGSIVACAGSPGQVNYTAAKSGLVGMTRSAARELASRGITVNLVLPGPIDTSILDDLTTQRREELLSMVPLRRMGTVEEVAAPIAFLCSDEASYMTGAIVAVDGGTAMGH
jgi:3-oxoacyl-[acyl-carrier protein] reductase